MVSEQETASFPPERRRVAVIGAGVSGLAAAKCLLDESIEPVIFEQASHIGGLWNYDEALPDGGGIMYRSLRTNTSRHTLAFSDFPLPKTMTLTRFTGVSERGNSVRFLFRGDRVTFLARDMSWLVVLR